jgi:hypothetical protein
MRWTSSECPKKKKKNHILIINKQQEREELIHAMGNPKLPDVFTYRSTLIISAGSIKENS